MKNRTPCLDRMAREGLRLTSFYGAPVCTPSRAQLMTGCYAKRVSLPNVLFPGADIGLSPREHSLAGPWKLAIVRQHEHSGQPEPSNPDVDKPFVPTLYNLDNDIGERHDVAAQHPDVVQRLQKLVKQMDADLGAAHIGPGVRPPGRFKNPTGLWLPGQEPSVTTK